MDKSTISMAIFNSKLFVYTRVSQVQWLIWVNPQNTFAGAALHPLEASTKKRAADMRRPRHGKW